MAEEKNPEEVLAEAINGLAQMLREQNLRENDMLLARLRQSRSRAEWMLHVSDEEYHQIMSELDAAEAAILKIRSEI